MKEKMPITIDLPPQMAEEAKGYATLHGTTLERMFIDYLAAELKRRQAAAASMARLRARIKKTGARLTGEPYKFNRADAYEPEHQKNVIMTIAGEWEDERSDDEIIREIEGARTIGREVSL